MGVYRDIHYFLIFALKHRLWVLVRTASLRVTQNSFGKKLYLSGKNKKTYDNLKMEDLLQHFKKMFSGETNDSENQDNPQNDVSFDEDLDADISLEELRKAVFHQKNKSACGLDNVCTEAIEASFDMVSSFLLKFVNQIFNSGEYPESWGQSIITQILKSGDANQAKTYRGIAASNILSKIYSQIVFNRLTDV